MLHTPYMAFFFKKKKKKLLVEKNVFRFSNRALRVGTTRNKWLK